MTATLCDHRGEPLAVGDRVTKTGIDAGAPAWATHGMVVGLGRTRVRVQWTEWSYDEAVPHHAVPTTTGPDGSRLAWALRRDQPDQQGGPRA